jgi:prepilin-type N-terminal cleavage/methylation domain-containing protein
MDRGARGVTLVELMVVVAIVGLLAAMFLTRAAQARRDAADTRAADALDQLRRIVMAYEAKTGRFPRGLWSCGGEWPAWVADVQSVLGDQQLGAVQTDGGCGTAYWDNADFNTGLFGGYPYAMAVHPRNGTSGTWFAATPYQLLKCSSGWWWPSGDVSSCQPVQ